MALNHLFDIATRYGGSIALAIADEIPSGKTHGSAYVFDLRSRAQLRKFHVRYERGGNRIALSRDDNLCFAGCYHAYGLGAYRCETGEEVWRRKDLKAVQSVVASEDEEWVFCGRQDAAAHLVEAASGKTVERFSGLKCIYPSSFDRSVVLAGRTLELHAPFGRKVATLKRTNNLWLQCAFSPSEFVVNEPDGMRCYDIRTQELLWSFPTQTEGRYTDVCYLESERAFIVGNGTWSCLDARTGTVRRTIRLAVDPGYVSGFCLRGSAVLATNLQMISLQTGAVIADLATPELVAWDPKSRIDRLRELAAGSKSLEELERYMTVEGFPKYDIIRVLLMKQTNDRKNP